MHWIIQAIIFLRILLPFSIFSVPVFSTITNFLVDWVDGTIFAILGVSAKKYQIIDKLLDLYWYIFILIFLYTTREQIPCFNLFISLFFFRFMGEVLFLATKKRKSLLFFPNIFEPFFWVYIAAKPLGFLYLLKPPFIPFIIAMIVAIKLPLEYIIHYKKSSALNWLSNLILHKNLVEWKE